jgi:hypothetical protein
MGKTSYGYSLRLVKLNGAALVSSLGVQLGRACIEHNVPVVAVAEHLGVSRQTVYNWFIGRSIPMKSTEQKINRFILSLSR